MGELSALPNIGKVVEEQLNAVGIATFAELKQLGSKEAWLESRQLTNPHVSTGCTPWKAQSRESERAICLQTRKQSWKRSTTRTNRTCGIPCVGLNTIVRAAA